MTAMQTRRCVRRFVAVALLPVLTVTVSAQFTWTDAGADSNWTNPDNWDPSTGYPATSGDDAIFDDTQVGTVDVDADTSIRYLRVSQPAGTNLFEIAEGTTLEAQYLQANEISVTNSAILRGGIFRPYSVMEVADKYTEAVYPMAYLTLSNTVFDVENLTELRIGRNLHHIRESFGLLDASRAQISYGGATNSLSVPTLVIGYQRGIGRMFLPPALTNIAVNSLYFGTYYHPGDWEGLGSGSWIDLGDQPQLQALKIKNFAQIGSGDFHYRDAHGVGHTNLPPNIDMHIGESGQPAIFRLAYMYNIPTDVRWGGFRKFEGYFSELSIAYCPNSQRTYGELDLSATNTVELAGDITSETVNTPYLRLGGLRTGSTGVLKLPGTITNMVLDTLTLGEFNDLTRPPNYSILHLGSNSQIRTVFVRDIFRQGLGKFQHVDSEGTLRDGFPGGVDFRVGTEDRRAEFHIGACNGLNSIAEFGFGIERFEAWLTSFTVAKRQDSWPNHYVTTTLDLRHAEVAALDVTGDAKIGHTQGSFATVHLPACDMRCANLTVGRVGIGHTTYDNNWFGHLYLSNAVVTVTNQATVNQTGRIFATLDGESCGLDLATTNLTVADPQPTTGIFGKIELTFASDPLVPHEDYFGLRLKGDAVAALQALNAADPARLTWDIDGLSSRNQNRFGIHYDADRDLTIVGLQRLPFGTLFIIR